MKKLAIALMLGAAAVTASAQKVRNPLTVKVN